MTLTSRILAAEKVLGGVGPSNGMEYHVMGVATDELTGGPCDWPEHAGKGCTKKTILETRGGGRTLVRIIEGRS